MGKNNTRFQIKYHRGKSNGSVVVGLIELKKYQVPRLTLSVQSTRDHLGSVARFEKLFRKVTLCLLEEGFTIWKGKYESVESQSLQQKSCVVCGYPMIGSKGFNDHGEPTHKACFNQSINSRTLGR